MPPFLEALEELVVLIEVFDRIGMVGAWSFHELVKVVGLALLGLLAHAVGRCNQSWVGWSALIPLVLLALLCGGALALVLALGLATVLTAAEDRLDRLLARGVVHGGVEQVAGGMGLHTAELVDQGLAGCLREEHADDVHVDDIRKGVALF